MRFVYRQGIWCDVTPVSKMLKVICALPSSLLNGESLGLWGNPNGVQEDDFTLPGLGNLVNVDQDGIFHWAQSCTFSSTVSLFYGFTKMFLDHVDENTM